MAWARSSLLFFTRSRSSGADTHLLWRYPAGGGISKADRPRTIPDFGGVSVGPHASFLPAGLRANRRRDAYSFATLYRPSAAADDRSHRLERPPDDQPRFALSLRNQL